jgi:DNA-binding response OmpR family regulator
LPAKRYSNAFANNGRAPSAVPSMKVLLVDDDEEFASGLANLLEKFNITAVLEHRVASAEKRLEIDCFDAVLLDVMLPEGNGFQFLPRIRRITDVPVIMLTALAEENELVTGLNLGADDYITKPFKAKELVARLRAVYRRYDNNVQSQTAIDDLELLRYQLLIRVDGRNVELTEVESNILHYLLNARNHYLSRDFLFQNVLKRDRAPDDRSLDVHISNIRRKLGPHPIKGNRIRSVRGLGYALTK